MRLGDLLESFQGLRALVVGDLMLDEYIFGRAARISQEAPVMVVRQQRTAAVPGGAANVAMNMVALGAKASIAGVVGDDLAGQLLTQSLGEYGIGNAGIAVDADRPTTRKTRVLANHAHQVLRIDHEDDLPVAGGVEQQVLDSVLNALDAVDVVLISDYQKGAVTGTMVEEIISSAAQKAVRVVANPKPRSLPHYAGASLVSLNRFEASEALGLYAALGDDQAEDAARQLREKLGVEALLITLGAGGMAAAAGNTFRVPAITVDVYDEAGAGDTVIATLALGIGAGSLSEELLTLATHTAGAVVKKVGVATPSADDLRQIGEIETG